MEYLFFNDDGKHVLINTTCNKFYFLNALHISYVLIRSSVCGMNNCDGFIVMTVTTFHSNRVTIIHGDLRKQSNKQTHARLHTYIHI